MIRLGLGVRVRSRGPETLYDWYSLGWPGHPGRHAAPSRMILRDSYWHRDCPVSRAEPRLSPSQGHRGRSGHGGGRGWRPRLGKMIMITEPGPRPGPGHRDTAEARSRFKVRAPGLTVTRSHAAGASSRRRWSRVRTPSRLGSDSEPSPCHRDAGSRCGRRPPLRPLGVMY